MYPVLWPSNDLSPYSPLTKSEPLILLSRVTCPPRCPTPFLPLQPLGIFLFLEHAKPVSPQGFATIDPSTWITLLPKSSWVWFLVTYVYQLRCHLLIDTFPDHSV